MRSGNRHPNVPRVSRDPGGGDRERKRPTYGQDWPSYRPAQEYEKEFFLFFLSELMDLVREPKYSYGRPRHRLSDVLKAMVIKVWVGKSAMRSKGDVRDAHRLGYLEQVPSSSTVKEYFGLLELTPILLECIAFVAAVMKPYESDFAIDSSGFRTSHYMRWAEEKWGRRSDAEDSEAEDTEDSELVERKSREWLKAHIVVLTKSQLVASVCVAGWRSSDYSQFVPLFERVTRLFNVERNAADAAYPGYSNFEAAASWGATLFAPFNYRHIRPADSDHCAWANAYRCYYDNFEEWYPIYHQRSLSETAFSTIKRLLGETIRSEKPVAQINELLLKVVSHNIIVLIHLMFKFDLLPFFASSDSRLLMSIPEKDRARLLRDGINAAHQWPVDANQFRHIRTEPPLDTGHIPDVFGFPHHTPQSDW